jgi:photosystem II stability/assembly factor-like uncharacterized protein
LRRLAAALAAGALVAAAAPSVANPSGCSVEQPFLAFKDPVVIDPYAAGGEPVSVVAQDGSITVSAHAGTTHLMKAPDAAPGASDFVVGYSNQTINWRSTDDGQSWRRIGLAPPIDTGPHSATSTGFSDPDLAIDQAGNLYNTEINLPQVAVYSSPDDGQSWPTANPIASSGDRPWLAANEPGEVFVLTNNILHRPLLRSTDGGLTFSIAHEDAPIDGKLITDPLNPDNGLIGPVGSNGMAISDDDGRTWTTFRGANLGPSTQFFGTVAADAAGNIYMAAAGGYTDRGNIVRNGSVTVATFDRASSSWVHVSNIDIPDGDALWPWIVAGDEGRVAVAWLQELPEEPRNRFALYAAVSTNAHARDSCGEASEPLWAVANASGRPVHEGPICLSGTACNLDRNSDRRLGDFITINFDADGDLFIVSGDTTLESLLDTRKPTANPVFVGASAGTRMLENPRETRATRCLYGLVGC